MPAARNYGLNAPAAAPSTARRPAPVESVDVVDLHTQPSRMLADQDGA